MDSASPSVLGGSVLGLLNSSTLYWNSSLEIANLYGQAISGTLPTELALLSSDIPTSPAHMASKRSATLAAKTS